ncbi:hypothetical protein Q8A73_004316 [Channa argus]|nr:hypothetical protein Q8A73_004316 [Channa argus]
MSVIKQVLEDRDNLIRTQGTGNVLVFYSSMNDTAIYGLWEAASHCANQEAPLMQEKRRVWAIRPAIGGDREMSASGSVACVCTNSLTSSLCYMKRSPFLPPSPTRELLSCFTKRTASDGDLIPLRFGIATAWIETCSFGPNKGFVLHFSLVAAHLTAAGSASLCGANSRFGSSRGDMLSQALQLLSTPSALPPPPPRFHLSPLIMINIINHITAFSPLAAVRKAALH